MGKLALKATALSAFVVVIAGASVACSANLTSPPGVGGDGGGGGGGGAECSAITTSDAQALVPQTVTVHDEGTSECQLQYGGTDIHVDYFLSDSDLTFYNSESEGASDHAITGIGDKAYWNEAVPQQTPPYLAAHKGNVTCTIQSNAPPDTTMVTSPSQGSYTVTDANALAYVQLMGKVCNDVLNAAQ